MTWDTVEALLLLWGWKRRVINDVVYLTDAESPFCTAPHPVLLFYPDGRVFIDAFPITDPELALEAIDEMDPLGWEPPLPEEEWEWSEALQEYVGGESAPREFQLYPELQSELQLEVLHTDSEALMAWMKEAWRGKELEAQTQLRWVPEGTPTVTHRLKQLQNGESTRKS